MKRPKNVSPVGSAVTLIDMIEEVELTLKERGVDWARYAKNKDTVTAQIARRRYEILNKVYKKLKEEYKSNKETQSSLEFFRLR